MIIGDSNVEQVTAFMCNLTSEYGDNPTEEQAESFARRERTCISPKEAISILEVKKWSDVVAFYNKEIGRLGPRTVAGKKQRTGRGRRYSNEELLSMLVTIQQENKGKEITRERLRIRAKHTPTPTWMTLTRRLGDPENWEQLIEQYLSSKAPTDKKS